MADYVSAIQNGDTQGTPSSVNVIVNGKNETWDIKNDHVELLQSTGLKDANGKEIYEGDIVKVFIVDNPEYDYQAPIKYLIDEEYPAFDIDTKYVPSTRWYDANILSTISESESENIEVIGNIHANPELLEAQHD
ncbi:YopX family protein [Levilactobacillus brevis]